MGKRNDQPIDSRTADEKAYSPGMAVFPGDHTMKVIASDPDHLNVDPDRHVQQGGR